MSPRTFWADYEVGLLRDEERLDEYKNTISRYSSLDYSMYPDTVQRLWKEPWDLIILGICWKPELESGGDISETVYPFEAYAFGKTHFPKAEPPFDLLMMSLTLGPDSELDSSEFSPETRRELKRLFRENERYADTRPIQRRIAELVERDVPNLSLDVARKMHMQRLYWTSGFYVAERIRQRGPNRGTPVIFVGNSERKGTKKAVRKIGKSYLLVEPFLCYSLSKILRRVLG